MFFANKWANLGLIALVALVICMLVVNATKVVDATGKETGNKLKAFAGGKDAATTDTKVG